MTTVVTNTETVMIDLAKIDQRENSRQVYKEADFSELMFSIKENGLLQPIGVTPITLNGEQTDRYEVVYGNRRLLAVHKLGWSQVPCLILDIKNENQRDIVNLIENLKRKNITILEEGRLYKLLVSRKLSTKEIAVRLDVHPRRIEVGLKAVEELPENTAHRVSHGGPGNRMKAGQIPASAAFVALKAAEDHALSKSAKQELFDHVGQPGVTTAKVYEAAALMRAGMSVGDAFEKVKTLRRISLSLFIDEKKKERIEKKFNKSIYALCYDALENLPYGVSQFSQKKTAYRTMSSRTTEERRPPRRGRPPSSKKASATAAQDDDI